MGVMAYIAAVRYGLTHTDPTEQQRISGWRQIWRHPSGALAMRNPASGDWNVSLDGYTIEPGFASSLRVAAIIIERKRTP